VNSFAYIVELYRFNTVTFYTVKRPDGKTEADIFVQKISALPLFKQQFDELLAWMEYIGNSQEGAEQELLRPEGLCVALPPPATQLQSPIEIRWYCYWINEQNVIMFNGGIKTARTAQQCPNVKQHFFDGQNWANQLNEIEIFTNGQNISNLDELYFEY